MIEKVYLKLRIANGIVGYIQNILITKSWWIQKDHLMHLTTNVIVALDKFIQKCDTLQNITSLGLPKNVILILPISRTCQYHQYIIKSNISKTFNISICQLPLAFTFCHTNSKSNTNFYQLIIFWNNHTTIYQLHAWHIYVMLSCLHFLDGFIILRHIFYQKIW